MYVPSLQRHGFEDRSQNLSLFSQLFTRYKPGHQQLHIAIGIPWLGPAVGPAGCPPPRVKWHMPNASEHSPQIAELGKSVAGTWNPICYHPASEDTNAWPPCHSVSTSTTEAWVSEPGGQSRDYWSGTPGDQLRHQHLHRTRPCTGSSALLGQPACTDLKMASLWYFI